MAFFKWLRGSGSAPKKRSEAQPLEESRLYAELLLPALHADAAEKFVRQIENELNQQIRNIPTDQLNLPGGDASIRIEFIPIPDVLPNAPLANIYNIGLQDFEQKIGSHKSRIRLSVDSPEPQKAVQSSIVLASTTRAVARYCKTANIPVIGVHWISSGAVILPDDFEQCVSARELSVGRLYTAIWMGDWISPEKTRYLLLHTTGMSTFGLPELECLVPEHGPGQKLVNLMGHILAQSVWIGSIPLQGASFPLESDAGGVICSQNTSKIDPSRKVTSLSYLNPADWDKLERN